MTLAWVEPEDAPAMAAIHALAFETPWNAGAFEALLRGLGAFGLLAPDGLILCRVVAGEMEVLTVGVAPAARRRGLGRRLMDAALDAGRLAGAEEAFLEVATDNPAAVALYERLGFARASVRPAYYDRGPQGMVDALVMHLDLRPGRP